MRCALISCYKHTIKFIIVLSILLFSKLSYSSFYLVRTPEIFSITYEVSNKDRLVLFYEKGSSFYYNFDGHKKVVINFSNQDLESEIDYKSVLFATDGYKKSEMYLLFDCLNSEEGRVVVKIDKSAVKEIRNEECKGL